MVYLIFGWIIYFLIIKLFPILDRATSHYSSDLMDIFKKFNSTYLLIPPGLIIMMIKFRKIISLEVVKLLASQ